MKKVSSKEQLTRLVINGYKSIADASIEFGALNVLIGSNGAGKSNLISFFRMIQQLLDGQFQAYVGREGGPDSLLYFGRKYTDVLRLELYFGNNGYKAVLEPTKDNRMMIAEESFHWNVTGDTIISRGQFETLIKESKKQPRIARYVISAMESWRVYHFHDTSDSAGSKRLQLLSDNSFLRPDGGNIAAFLYRLERNHPREFTQIVQTVRLVAPFFGKFLLRPSPLNSEAIELEWFENGRDVPFKAHHLSDGTLRFICLATVFLQPIEFQPETVLVDEPELGLHPYAITTLAALMRSCSNTKQIIVSTQSVELLNEFGPEDVLVVEKHEGRSSFKRLDQEQLSNWLQDYSLGELWKKNLLGGRPSR